MDQQMRPQHACPQSKGQCRHQHQHQRQHAATPALPLRLNSNTLTMSQKQPACSADAGVVATDVGSDAISSKHVGQGNVTPTAKHAKRLTLQFPIVISDSVAASYALQTDVGCGSRQRPSTNSTRRAGLTLERRSTDPGSRDSSERSNEPRVEGGDQSSDAAMFFRQANAAKADDTADPSLTSPQALENEDAVDGGTAFLTALAAQERKVLELREELHKAEAELTSLKKHWAASEHFKKDSELRFQTEAMKFMKRPSLSSHPADTPLPEQQHGQGTGLLRRQSISVAPTPSDRRPSIARHSHSPSLASTASASPRTSKPRTVFQGSKHTRTLSLLANRNSSISLPQPDQFRLSGMRSNSSIDHPPRSLTLPSIDVTKQSLLSPTAQAPHSQRSPTAARDQTRSEGAALRRALAGHPAAESLVRTGQQMAADLKDNLWTFIEDIRQAAVGEELSRPVPRPNNGATSTSACHYTNGTSTRARVPPRGPGHVATRSVSSPLHSSRTSRASSVSKPDGRAPVRKESDDAGFWRQYGIDVNPEPTSSKTDHAASPNSTTKNQAVTPAAQPTAATGGQTGSDHHRDSADLMSFDDSTGWGALHNPQASASTTASLSRSRSAVSHTPTSSTSTWNTKRSQSPSTAASSPLMSARHQA